MTITNDQKISRLEAAIETLINVFEAQTGVMVDEILVEHDGPDPGAIVRIKIYPVRTP